MNINPFALIVAKTISLYSWAVIIYFVMIWLVRFEIIKKNNKYVTKFMEILAKFIEPVLEKIRKHIPLIGGVDISPIILIAILSIIESLVLTFGQM